MKVLMVNGVKTVFFAYPIDKDTSLTLCCTFEQNAVVYVTSDGLPILLLNPKLSEFA